MPRRTATAPHRPTPRLRFLAAAIVAVATVPLAAIPAGTAYADTADTAAPADRYVALGDSFTAGPLIPEPYGDPALCLRSRRNYPNLVAETLGITDIHDVSCTSARTGNMTAPQDLAVGQNPPQLDALTTDTTLVTVGIGGGDFGYSEILLSCATMGLTNPAGAPCRDRYTTGDGDELVDRAVEVEERVAGVLAEIAERSPHATVAVVGYLQILPEGDGCWPMVPFARGDVGYLDGAQTLLNTHLERAADAAGAIFVDVFARGHDVCQNAADKWVEGIIPTRPAAPVHPNESGMAATAERVVAAVSAPATTG